MTEPEGGRAATRPHMIIPRGCHNLSVAFVACLLFLLLISGSRHNALTADEPAHIAAGYAFLARGQQALWIPPEFRTQPLANVISASLLFLSRPQIPLDTLDGWSNSFPAFFRAFSSYFSNRDSAAQFQMLARLPTVFVTVILGMFVYRWTKEVFDGKAALLALIVFTLDPNLLAHGRLATTDVAVTLFGIATLYFTLRWVKTMTWRLTFVASVLLGLTLLSKPSGIVWVGFVGLVVLNKFISQIRRKTVDLVIIKGVALLVGSFGLLWAAYGFSLGHISPFSIPVPAHPYWDGFLKQARIANSRWVYAWGARGYGRFWWYFPAAFLVKNPLPLLLLGGIGVLELLKRKPERSNFAGLLAFSSLYVGIAIVTGPNIGYRHLLPLHPFFHMAIGGGIWQWIRSSSSRHWRRRFVTIILIGWYVWGTLQIWPNELAFFNELIGGPDNGYLYLVDSNLDWGQTSPEVIAEASRRYDNLRTAPPIDSWTPDPGWYLVSASSLQGLNSSDPFVYERFRHLEPEAIVNHTLLIYNVPHFEADWLAQCASPAAPLDETTILGEMGESPRIIDFDCRNAWIYPAGSGIYALGRDSYRNPRPTLPTFLLGPPAPRDPIVETHLENTRLSFHRAWTDRLPSFLLYEMDSLTVRPEISQAYIASALLSPSHMRSAQPTTLPVGIENPLSALGVTFYPANGGVLVETWWRSNQTAIERPFSIMAHLIMPDGRVIEVADGFAISPLILREGDIVAQYHRFDYPPDLQGELWLRTGAYWLDTMSRWEIGPTDQARGLDALYFPVPPN